MAGGGAWLAGGGRRRRRCRHQRVDPAGMDPAVQAVGRLRIDGVSVQNQAPKRRLDVPAWAAEPIVEIEMAKGGIEIVAPEQADHATAKPDAFRVAGWPAQGALGFRELVDLLRFFAGLLAGGRWLLGGLGAVGLGGGLG